MRRGPLITVLLLVMLGLAGCGTAAASSGPSHTAAPAYKWSGITLQKAASEPSITLTDTAGQSYDLAQQTAGKVTLIYFGYTHCPNLCPVVMATVAGAFKQLTQAQQADIRMVFITTDPGVDTPHVIRVWLDKFNAQFVELTGTQAQLTQAQVAMSLVFPGFPPATKGPDGSITHAALMPAYGPNGTSKLFYLVGSGTTATGIADDLRHLLAGDQPG